MNVMIIIFICSFALIACSNDEKANHNESNENAKEETDME